MAASHPAGALIASELARAAGVVQTEPTFVIMPEDPALGEFLAGHLIADRLRIVSQSVR